MTIFDRGGFVVVEGLFNPSLLAALQADARERRASAKRAIHAGPNEEEWRGGQPPRALWSNSAGPIEYEVFGSPAAADALSQICGLPIQVSGSGSYSYYCEPGDFLALHRDIVRCDIATITCLQDDGPPQRGGLCVYPGYIGKPLSALRRDKPAGLALPCAPGQTVILAGGVLPHEVTPATPGQQRTVALACYRAVA